MAPIFQNGNGSNSPRAAREVFGGLTFTTSYTYDGVNRLQQAVESGPGGGWMQTYGYDQRATAG